MSTTLLGFVLCLVLAASAAPANFSRHWSNQTEYFQRAPLIYRPNPCHGRYMVSFKDNHTLELHQQHLGYNIDKLHIHWNVSSTGYAATLDDISLDLVRTDPRVAFVEQDYYLETPPWEVCRKNESLEARSEVSVSTGQGWNLMVMSVDGKLEHDVPYQYDTRADGKGVDVYILDTGILKDHTEFQGRIHKVHDLTHSVTADEYLPNGHGTAVASIIGGRTRGVAREANLIPVKIAKGPDAKQYASEAVQGITFVMKKHMKARHRKGFRGSVANWSLDVLVDPAKLGALHQAISAANAEGVVQVAAAGNSGDLASNHVPAVYSEIITVGSIDPQYKLATHSSYGPAVDILAPGVNIAAAGSQSKTAFAELRGTSFAAPHVTGVIAILMSSGLFDTKGIDWKNGNPFRDALLDFSVKDVVSLPDGPGDDPLFLQTPNKVVNNGFNTKNFPGRDELKI